MRALIHETDHGHGWSEKAPATVVTHPVTVATALAEQPVPA